MTDDERTKAVDDVRAHHDRLRRKMDNLTETLPRYASFREQYTHAQANLAEVVQLANDLKGKLADLASAYPSSAAGSARSQGAEKGK